MRDKLTSAGRVEIRFEPKLKSVSLTQAFPIYDFFTACANGIWLSLENLTPHGIPVRTGI